MKVWGGTVAVWMAYRISPFLPLVLLLMVLATIPACRTTPLNKQAADDWYMRYATLVRWVGYQGSDQHYHHFIARVMDDWNFIQIRKEELTVEEERPYSNSSHAPLYYYLVDPSQDYRRIEPQGQQGAAAPRL